MQCRCSCRDRHLITVTTIVILLIARTASRWTRHLLGNLEMYQLASGRRQSRLRHRSAVLYPSIHGQGVTDRTQDAGHSTCRLGVGG